MAASEVLSAEWIKSRSVPDSWAFAAAAAALGIGWATLPLLLNPARWSQEFAAAGAEARLGPLFWIGITRLTVLAVILLGALLVTGERESGTAVVTRTVLPRPLGVYAAKTGVAAVWGLGVGLFTGTGALIGIRLIIGPVAAPLTTEPSVLFGFGFRTAVITALCALLGVGLAAVTRNLLLTAVIGSLWVWFENLIASFFGEFGHLGVLTPWRNLSYFLDREGFGLPYLWDAHWGFAPLALLALALLVTGAVRHRHDTNTVKE